VAINPSSKLVCTGADQLSSVYADSSPDPLDDPKVETVVELLRRVWVGEEIQLT